MNIMMYTFPFRGHSMQAISIANYLYNNGHHVTVDAHPSFFQYISSGIKKTECLYQYLKFEDDTGKDNLLNWAEGVFVTTQKYELHEYNHIDMIIYDSMAYWGKYLAEKHNLPAVALMTIQPFTREQFYSGAYEKIIKDYIPASESSKGFLRKLHIYQVVAKKKFNLMDDFSFDDFLCARGNKNIVLLPQSLCKYRNELGDSYVAFSPIIKNEKITNQKNGSIYLATGSMISDIELLSTCIDTLLPYQRILHVSSGNFTNQLRKKYYDQKNVFFYEFAPQIELLRQASLFITHGGSNSICESIAAKTPMVVIPLVNDEYLNAEMIVECGIGLQIENNRNIIKSTLGDYCEQILNDKAYVKRIDEISKEINPSKVWKTIDEIIEDNTNE